MCSTAICQAGEGAPDGVLGARLRRVLVALVANLLQQDVLDLGYLGQSDCSKTLLDLGCLTQRAGQVVLN